MNEDFYKEACRRKLKQMQQNDLHLSTSNIHFQSEPSAGFRPNDQIRKNVERIKHCLKYDQYDKLFSLMQDVSLPVLLEILPHFPFDKLYQSIPRTLPFLDVVFSRLLQASYRFNKSLWEMLQLNHLMPKLILIFANGLLPTMKGEKNCNSYFPTCLSLLMTVSQLDPSLPRQLISSQDAIKSCIDQLAGHSLVDCKNNSLKSLPLAIQTELADVIQQKKQVLQKLNDFYGKMSTSNPSDSSHQRLLQISEEEVENRVFQNVSLLAIIEPALKDETIRQLTKELQQRIENDKTLLRTYKSLEKMVGKSEQSRKEAIAITLHKFLHGYRTALELLEENKNKFSTRENNQNRFSDAENPSLGIQHTIGNSSPVVSDITEPFVTTAGRWPFDDGITNIGGLSSASTNGLDFMKPQNLTYEKEDFNSRFIFTTTPTKIAGNSNNSSRKFQENKSKGVNYFVAAGRKVSKNYSSDRRRKRSTLDDLEELIAPDRNVGGDGSRQSTCDSFEESITCSSSQVDSASSSGVEFADKELLLQEVQNLRIELEHSRQMICKLQQKEHQLRDRLSEQAHKQFTISNSHFEDLSLNEKRPTELIRLYGNLYSETRVDAADDLDNLTEISDFDKLKTKILFSVVVLAFRSTYEYLLELKSKVHNLLHIQVGDVNNENADLPSLSLEAEIDDYIRKTVDRHDCSANVEDVCSKLYMALFDYPCLRQSKGLRQYIEECVRVAWALNVQNPRYIISYDMTHFDPHLHTRFHTSELAKEEILEFLWPALVEENGACVFKAVVIT